MIKFATRRNVNILMMVILQFNKRQLHQSFENNVRKVLAIYTGGTIGMQKNENGVYTPVPNKFFELLKKNPQTHSEKLAKVYGVEKNQLFLPQIKTNCIISYKLIENSPLLDSSNISAENWIQMTECIEKFYQFYDGFVILHGTDTLAYTASALSFMLQGLQKPVIITGSQIPMFEARNDALNNFISSVLLAGCYHIPEVCVFFGNKLTRGNRTTKLSSKKFDTFDSPNYPLLAEFGSEILVKKFWPKCSNEKSLTACKNLEVNVTILTIYPSILPVVLKTCLEKSSGVVLRTYGTGNICSSEEIIKILKEAVCREVLIVNITQCLHGGVNSNYETGEILSRIGIVSGHDMTTEAAFTKLCYVLGLPQLTHLQRTKLMQKNICGELTNNPIK